MLVFVVCLCFWLRIVVLVVGLFVVVVLLWCSSFLYVGVVGVVCCLLLLCGVVACFFLFLFCFGGRSLSCLKNRLLLCVCGFGCLCVGLFYVFFFF